MRGIKKEITFESSSLKYLAENTGGHLAKDNKFAATHLTFFLRSHSFFENKDVWNAWTHSDIKSQRVEKYNYVLVKKPRITQWWIEVQIALTLTKSPTCKNTAFYLYFFSLLILTDILLIILTPMWLVVSSKSR